MKSKVMKRWNCLMLRKRFIIETVFYQLKTYPKSSILRHRRCINFMVNLLVWLIAYSFQPKKLNIKMTRFDRQALIQI
ncbi:hypothetical protein BTN49_2278 (plasmid) [Candidatus Enterovibrio escicola]|uniref:Transposase DDE domain-containing protein n=1 Tax=Candidatus Enterovibrio escicola TaxID=1927127 RepID=A0A2A5T1P0_9GAMM|nr:hypothetical protein BTN49_2278 [Candidatus Enterovibrio escacola]